MRYTVVHSTRYAYATPASVSHHLLHLAPRPGPRQRVLAQSLEVDPAPDVREAFTDYFGNPAGLLAFHEPHAHLHLTSRFEVETLAPPAPDPGRSPPWEDVRADLAAEGDPALAPVAEFRFDSPLVAAHPLLAEYALSSFPDDRPLLAGALELMHRLHDDLEFDPKATSVSTPLLEAFARRRGVCQDFAHLMTGCLRSLGLAARYVSGYLETLPPPGREKLVGSDASHAWLSVWCPLHGWVDLDPTNACLAGERHVVVAWGRDYADISPVRGVILGGDAHQVDVAVDVIPVDPARTP